MNHDDFSVWLFRRGIIRELIAEGHEVHIVCSDGPYVRRLVEMGVTHVHLDIPRFATPWRDLKGIVALTRIFMRHRYGIVHLFQVKLLAYGVIAGRLAGMRRCVGSSTGAGILMNNYSDFRSRALQRLVRLLYSVTIPRLERVLFQNDSDRDHFVAAGFVKQRNTVVVHGSGVNLEEYSEGGLDSAAAAALRTRCGSSGNRVVVTMIARVVASKGVREFLAAAEMVERKRPGAALFLLFGDVEPGNPDTLASDEVRRREGEHFRWMGWTDQVPEALAISDIVVLPSYREGTPRVLLEAMAMGKPIVTTDAPGCTNVIEHGRNGFMVPVRDIVGLGEAILALVGDETKRDAFGRRSLLKVREEFEEGMIARMIVERLYHLVPAVSAKVR